MSQAAAMAKSAGSAPPIHILYVHGINQVGAGDSLLLRNGICKYLGECKVTRLGRVYAEGPFAVNATPPALEYMQDRIWKTQEDWNASAPFIDRYEIAGHGHTPILLDEVNWWPLAYPLKCKWLITRDATLTGASKELIDVCATPSQRDPDHPGRYLTYQWILPPEAADLQRIPRHAAIVNRSLKSGLMDWGFGDAVMALGPMEEILSAGIRELLMRSLESAGVNLQTAKAEDTGPQFFFVTHSLGSYLSLAALDSDLVGPQGPEVPQLKVTSDEKNAADLFRRAYGQLLLPRKPDRAFGTRRALCFKPAGRQSVPPHATRDVDAVRETGGASLDRALAVLASALSAAPRCSSARPTDYRLERPERPTFLGRSGHRGRPCGQHSGPELGFQDSAVPCLAYQCAC